jgi:hypothetical protein
MIHKYDPIVVITCDHLAAGKREAEQHEDMGNERRRSNHVFENAPAFGNAASRNSPDREDLCPEGRTYTA